MAMIPNEALEPMSSSFRSAAGSGGLGVVRNSGDLGANSREGDGVRTIGRRVQTKVRPPSAGSSRSRVEGAVRSEQETRAEGNRRRGQGRTGAALNARSVSERGHRGNYG